MPELMTVACRVPMGLKIRVHEPPRRFGGDPRGMPTGEMAGNRGEIVLRGPQQLTADSPDLVSGYALNYNVDADLFRQWMDENRGSALVANGLVRPYTAPPVAPVAASTGAPVRFPRTPYVERPMDFVPPRDDPNFEPTDEMKAALQQPEDEPMMGTEHAKDPPKAS